VIDVTDETFPQIAQLSSVVPIVVDLWAEWCEPCKTLGPILERITKSLGGKVLLAKVDVDANPQLTQAFQAQSIPTVAAIVGGKPISLFQGAVPEQQVREVFTQLLELAAQSGVNGRVNPAEGGAVNDEPAEPELPPLHQEAFDAIERGDYAAAISAYEQAIVQNPRDDEAQAGLAQVRLLHRLQGKSLDDIRTKASAEPTNIEAQLDVADLDVSGGHIEDAFIRLLETFASADDEGRQVVRERLLELFDIVGLNDPRVLAARRQLTSLLY
jgi:putative thioredoxin